MPFFKRFGPGDQLDNVLILEPKWELASGTSGWHGSPEGSASLSLYGGAARQTSSVIRQYRYDPIIPGANQFGQLVLPNPITASVHHVYLTSEERSISQRSSERWGHEHWKEVGGLYRYYYRKDPDYVTSSYDHYCLYFNSGSTNIVSYSDRTQANPNLFRCLPTASFAIEAWIKPFVSGSPGNDMTIVSRARSFKLKIDGSSNKLVFAAYDGTASTAPSFVVTGTDTVTPGVWHHVAATFDQSNLGLYLDLDLQALEPAIGFIALSSPINYTGSLHIGAEWGGTVTSQGTVPNQRRFEDVRATATGLAGTVFHGFIGEVRMWGTGRTSTQLSASYNQRLTGSNLAMPLLAQFRLSEGPLTNCIPDVDPLGTQWVWQQPSNPQGSGTINWAANYQGNVPDTAILWSFDSRLGPSWHPNDNTNYYLPKQLALTYMSGTNWGSGSAPVQRMRVISVPQAFFGRQIVPGSVRVVDNSFTDETYRLKRTLIDDGRGGLFLSGSAASSSLYFNTATTYATASWFNVNPTSSIEFVARVPGPGGNGYSITLNNLGSAFNPNFFIDETDPANVALTIPMDDVFNPIGTAWSFYQFMATSSAYLRPVAFHGNPDDLVHSVQLTPYATDGGAYGSTQMSMSLDSSLDYRGVEWNKVGNVFYNEGLIVIKDPALLDFGQGDSTYSNHGRDLIQVNFRGSSRIPVKTLMCRMDPGELNASLNPSFYSTEEDGDRVRTHPSGSIWVTTVGIYNDDRELVAVAKLAEPYEVRAERANIHLRIDF